MEPMDSPQCTGDEVWDFSNGTVPYGVLYGPLDTTVTTVVNPCLLALGLVGNLAFLFVTARVRSMRTVTNAYLVNMALADTGFLLVAVSEKLASYRASPVRGDRAGFGLAGCLLTFALLDLCYFASVILVTLVSLEKFYAVCRPVQHRLIGGKARTARLVAGAWLLSLAFTVVLLPAWASYVQICTFWPPAAEYRGFPARIAQCQALWSWYVEFHNGFQTVPFFLAFAANSVLYAKIVRRLSARAVGGGRVGPQDAPTARQLQRQRVRNQVAVMLVANGLVFFVCLAPFQITSAARSVAGLTGGDPLLSDVAFDRLVWAARILTYANPVLNPLIYNLTNPRYRAAFRQAFTCRRGREKGPPNKDRAGQEDTESTLNT